MKTLLNILTITLVLGGAGLKAQDKPNVIVIMADDIGFECYSHKGSEFYQTPNIDQLAATGVEFTQAYSQPICTPSRVRIMTGRYNFRNYTRFGELDLTQPTFATMVKRNGYATAIAGKWQLSPGDLDGPHKVGFDDYCLWHFSPSHGRNDGKAPLPEKFLNKGSRFKSPRLFENGKLVPDTEGKYGPDLVSDFICEFIERKKDEPFFVYYPMILTHSPFVPTPDSVDWKLKDENREPIEHFREMVNYMDKVIGKIVNKLDETGLRDNTLIIVTGDNGTNVKLTSPFPPRGQIRGGKGTMQDAGNRVAFVANWRGV
ncbi:MAG: arylsulfatase A, partial [Mariniblastus sp.]